MLGVDEFFLIWWLGENSHTSQSKVGSVLVFCRFIIIISETGKTNDIHTKHFWCSYRQMIVTAWEKKSFFTFTLIAIVYGSLLFRTRTVTARTQKEPVTHSYLAFLCLLTVNIIHFHWFLTNSGESARQGVLLEPGQQSWPVLLTYFNKNIGLWSIHGHT